MTEESTPATGQERRITLRLLAYWEQLRGERDFPHEREIEPEALADLWDHCFLIRTRDLSNTFDYNFTYLGSAIRNAYLSGMLDDAFTGLISPNASQLSCSFGKVLETRSPIMEDGEFRNLRGQVVKFRQALLPFGEVGDITAIFGGMRFKIFD